MAPTTKLTNTAYIAGPMTGIPDFNFPAFDAVAERCRTVDHWYVWNPHEHDQETYPGIDDAAATKAGDVAAIVKEVGFNFQDAMIWDLQRVAQADHLVLLPGWENSTGAKAERFVGEMTGSKIWLANPTARCSESARCSDPQRASLDCCFGWTLTFDWEQKRLTGPQLEESTAEGLEARITSYTNIVPATGGNADKALTEVRVVDPNTGGAKGSKLARFDLVPWDAMTAIAEHYGRGARKYAERNWERGYDWSLSYAACIRHLIAFWEGEDIDSDPSLYTVDGQVVEEPASLHVAAAAWHCLNLLAFYLRGDGNDNRPSVRENG